MKLVEWSFPIALLFILMLMLPSFLVAAVATYVVRRIAPRVGLVDLPDSRKVHVIPTPLGGGIGIWFGLVTPLAIAQLLVYLGLNYDIGAMLPAALTDYWKYLEPHLPGFWEKSLQLWILLALGSILSTIGLIDDLKGLSWKLRLGVQFAIAAYVVWGLDWKLSFFVSIPWVPEIATIFWIVGLINSFNMLDNMDGLSAGIATIGSIMLAAVLLLSPEPTQNGPQLFVGGFLLLLAGSALGFLFHNRPPAKIFMGDTGSYLIGFCMAVMTILATFGSYDPAKRHAILAPLCILAVPLYDMITVLWIRIREGRSPFQPDKCHFSHRLVDLGFTKTQAVLVIYLLTATCGLGALLLHRVDQVGAIMVLLLVFCVLCLIALLESAVRRSARRRSE